MAKRERRKNLKMQTNDVLQSLCKFGQSKHQAKKEGTASEGIYSYETYHTYQQQCHRFCDWVRDGYPGTKMLSDARQYVDSYLQSMIDSDMSPFTIKTAASALAKLYQCRTTDFIKTPARNRANITRSRGRAVRDQNFDENSPENARLVRFCKACGLRRSELRVLRGSWYIENPDGTAYIDLAHTSATKGGRPRTVPILPEDIEFVRKMCRVAGDDKVFPVVNENADVHSYRACYCRRLYDYHCPDITKMARKELYYCQKDKAGIVYHRDTLRICSEALGHSGISIIPSNYLHE